MEEVIILSDEEFYKMKKQDKRKDFLKELEKISKPSKADSFSIKNVKKEESKEIKKKDKDELSFAESMAGNIEYTDNDSDSWNTFLTDLSEFEISPIESITDENITGFRLHNDYIDEDENKYGKVFKKELAMLSEVLKDVKSHGSMVNSALKKINIGGKGSSSRVSGVPKGYSDLVVAYNTINTTKIQLIKAMSDLRSKQIDWQLKDKANNPEENESVDSIADMYYKKIVNGGTKNFINSNLGQYQQQQGFEYDNISDLPPSNNDDLVDSMTMGGVGFNITQPINGAQTLSISDIEDGDEFGYIKNENTNYEIVAYQCGDNKFQLCALDEYGEPIEDIELPSDVDPTITESLRIKPGSNYVHDKYGRTYKIIEMGEVDISDVDNMEYPY